MKKNKKKIIIFVVTFVIISLLIGILYLFMGYKNDNSLTLEENKCIDSNKYEMIDIALINDIPILSYEGDGLVYDYLDFVTKNYSLKFNVIPYKLDGTVEYKYKMDIVDNPQTNDIILLKDNLVLVTNKNIQYADIDDINNLKIGIMKGDKTILSEYFVNKKIELIEYNTYNELKKSILESKENLDINLTPNVDGIIIPKTIFAKEIIENNYNISFQFNDLNKFFVLKESEDKVLTSILSKTFNIWKEEYYDEEYNSKLLKNYFDFKKITDEEQKKLKSKNYNYGFIDYGIFNNLENDEISGFNGLILKDFNLFSGLTISYTRYNSMSKLLQDFNSKKIDFILNIGDNAEYKNKIFNTIGVFKKNLVIVSGINNNIIVDNIKSLQDKEVLTIKNTYLEKYLTENGIKIKSYNNINDLSKDYTNNDIVILDLENYNYYKTSIFRDSKIDYIISNNENYNYIVNDVEENKLFEDLFNFYLSFNSIDRLISNNYNKVAYENSNITYLLVIIIIILLIYLCIDFTNHIKYMIKTIKKNKKINLSKEEKIKYIDQLTSLKNRAYLNSRIESWDSSEVYPQAIIVIDLNNVSYVNDNYGREEGDKVITEAANILIMHQLQNSEIVRTDGNEFLIYLVGYNEKQIISYLRKLGKEFKKLSHGFGAATGYSIINDAIKTVDDAVNEATLDMKNNKEDIDY